MWPTTGPTRSRLLARPAPRSRSFTPSANAESPCALAVDSNGNLYVNGKNTDVVKYKPEGGFPPTPSTTYVPDTSVNGTGVLVPAEAKGVAVNSATDDVYIPFSGHISSYDPDGTLISRKRSAKKRPGELAPSTCSVDVRGSRRQRSMRTTGLARRPMSSAPTAPRYWPK